MYFLYVRYVVSFNFFYFNLRSICHAFTTHFLFRHVTLSIFFFFFFSKTTKKEKSTFTFVSLFARFCSVSLALISLPTGEMFLFVSDYQT